MKISSFENGPKQKGRCQRQDWLAYTVALDAPGHGGQRNLAKFLISSLLRTGWPGYVIVFHNGEKPLFQTPRAGVEEVGLELVSPGGTEGAELAWGCKYRVAEFIPVEDYEKILFLDADCLALRDLSPLVQGDWDIAVQPERGTPITAWNHYSYLSEAEMNDDVLRRRPGVNSGTWAVRGSAYREVMAEWSRIDISTPLRECRCRDQSSWNRLVLDNVLNQRWKLHEWHPGQIAFPLYLHPRYDEYSQSLLVHQLGGNTLEKLRFTSGLWFETFIHEDSCMFFNFLEM